MTSKRKGEHVHKTRSSRNIVALVMGLLMALALGSVPALAEDTGDNSRTITTEIAIEKYKADIEGIADKDAVVVDAYQIATADYSGGGFTFKLVAPFDNKQELKDAIDKSDWEKLADSAADIVIAGKQGDVVVRSAKLGEDIVLPNGVEGEGIWLLMPHGKSQKATSLAANSATHKYTFKPSVVWLPNKDNLGKATAKIKPARDNTVEPPDTPRKVVKTGEETTLTPFYVAMGVSGGLLALLAIQGVFSRKREADKKSA